MKTVHLTYPTTISEVEDTVVALGFFDGVHRGHQEVIRNAEQLANEQKIIHSVMTFQPHPREVLSQVKDTRYLTPFSEKQALFTRLGVKQLLVMKFDEAFSKLSPQDFVERVLWPLGVKGVVTGFNFHFGQGGRGNGNDLEKLGGGVFKTRIVPPVLDEKLPISSTRIRTALTTGDVDSVTRYLGRAYAFRGRVVGGDQRGRTIGFPTANLQLSDAYWIPARGVYVVRVQTATSSYYGMMNIGVRPTFDHPVPREVVEVHLLQFTGDLYDQELTIELLHFLRPEKKFSSVDQLIRQIEEDRQIAEQWILETEGSKNQSLK